MERKITKMGPSSLVVSLPSKWVKRHKLMKGDNVEVIEQHKKLIISIEATKKEDSKISFNAQDVDPLIERFMGILYKKGVDEMTIMVDTPQQRTRVINNVHNLIGFEIIDQKDNIIIIRNIAKDSPEEFHVVVKRFLHSLTSYADEMLQALENNDKETLISLQSYDTFSNKLSDYCKRLLFRYNLIEYSILQYAIVRDIEMVADEYKFIGKLYHGKEKFDKKLIPLYKKSIAYIKDFYNFYYKKDLSLYPAFVENARALKKETLKMFDDATYPNNRVLQNLLNVFQRVFDMNSPLATLIVQETSSVDLHKPR